MKASIGEMLTFERYFSQINEQKTPKLLDNFFYFWQKRNIQ
jgi:hypothetical protein